MLRFFVEKASFKKLKNHIKQHLLWAVDCVSPLPNYCHVVFTCLHPSFQPLHGATSRYDVLNFGLSQMMHGSNPPLFKGAYTVCALVSSKVYIRLHYWAAHPKGVNNMGFSPKVWSKYWPLLTFPAPKKWRLATIKDAFRLILASRSRHPAGPECGGVSQGVDVTDVRKEIL